MKVFSVFGTRPEAIKMCPLVVQLEENSHIESRVCLTGQHREMLQSVIDAFKTRVDYSLDIMRPQQTLFTITTDILDKIAAPLQREKPDIVLVHGDTSTSFAAALAAFYLKIPVGHVEAGLRTYNPYSPFPEEMNRVLTGHIAALHFAPTEGNRQNLQKENVHGQVFVTGNTVIDALRLSLGARHPFQDKTLAALAAARFHGRRVVLLTAHRRENLGAPMEQIFTAVRRLHDDFADTQFIYPVHMNPQVKKPAEDILGGLERVTLLPPLGVTDMHGLIAQSFLVLTDSGGLQEEAPYCNVPVLVLRTETERPAAVKAGTVRVVGVEADTICKAAAKLLTDKAAYAKMANATNPYGDGHASERIVQHLLDWHAEQQPR